MFHPRTQAVLTVLALAGLATAATAGTLTVGPPGSGAGFTEIQAAVDASQPGDVILVAPGVYDRFTVDLPLSVIAEQPGTAVVRTAVSVPATYLGALVTGIPAGAEVLLSGLAFDAQSTNFGAGGPPPCLLVQSSTGNVLLHELLVQVGVQNPVGFIAAGPSLQVQDSALVVVTNSTIHAVHQLFSAPDPAVQAVDSGLWFAGSSIEGAGSQSWTFSQLDSPGIVAQDSVVYLAETAVRGGDAFAFVGSCPGSPPGSIDLVGQTGSSALIAKGSSAVKVAGGPGSVFAPGATAVGIPCTLGDPAFGIELRDFSQAIVPDSSGSSSLGVFENAAAHSTAEHYPTLSLAPPSVSPGGAATLVLSGTAQSVQLAFFALETTTPLSFPGIDGALWLSPAKSFLLGTAVLASDFAGATLGFAVPADPQLVGLDLPFQAVEVTANQLALSGPTLLVVRP